MKRVLFGLLILFFFAALVQSDTLQADLIEVSEVRRADNLIIIKKGLNDGIRNELDGKIIGKMSGKFFDIGEFEVDYVRLNSTALKIKVVFDKEKGRKFTSEDFLFVKFWETLKRPIDKSEKYEILKKNWNRFLGSGKLDIAQRILNDAKRLNFNNQEVDQYFAGINLLLQKQIPLLDFFKYAIRQHDTRIYSRLKAKVYTQYPNLVGAELIKKGNFNRMGYFELTLSDSHTMVFIPDKTIFVDKYEVSNAQFFGASEKGNKPALVTYDEAEKYCENNGFRLPTEEEWEYIAGKNQGFKYSWGNEPPVGNDGMVRANFRCFEDIDGYKYTAPVTEYNEFSSPYDIFNLSGNAWEWVKENYCKGGGYLSSEKNLEITSRTQEWDRAGFRCVKEI